MKVVIVLNLRIRIILKEIIDQSKSTIKENQKKKNLKKKNLITSTKSRVLNNTKIYQPKAEMQEKKKINQKIEREIIFFCEEKLCKGWKKE